MAKNNIPPDKIPIKEFPFEVDAGVVAFSNFSKGSDSEKLNKIIDFLDSKCDNAHDLDNYMYALCGVDSDECIDYLSKQLPDLDRQDIENHVVVMGNAPTNLLTDEEKDNAEPISILTVY